MDHDLDDAVIRGEGSGLPAELVPVARVLAALRSHASVEPAPPMSAALRAQLEAPNVVALRAARSLRRAAAVAAAAAVVVVVVGVGAAQNRLPSQLQDVVASTAELVGIDVPRSDERGSARSGEGHERGRDDTAPHGPAGGGPDPDGSTPGGAIPAVPGGPDGSATTATPPDKEEKAEKAEKAEKPATAEEPTTPAPAEPVVPDGAPGQDEGTPPANPRSSSAQASSPPPSHPNGGESGGGQSGTTKASAAPGQSE
ncbi:MAG: hypothetical protein ACLGI8_11365 [Acidimicrobiia bacterium]